MLQESWHIGISVRLFRGCPHKLSDTLVFCHHWHTISDRSERLRMAETPEQGNSRLSQAQAQVGEVVDIMRVNVEKVLERDSKLSELDQRADNLQEGANQFQTQVQH